MAAPGQLNLDESPSWGSRSVDCFEKLEQIGEGTYGYSMPSIHALLLMGFFFYFLCMFNFLHYYCIPRLMILWNCSMVYMAREIRTGEIVALKKIRMDNEKEGVSSIFCR